MYRAIFNILQSLSVQHRILDTIKEALHFIKSHTFAAPRDEDLVAEKKTHANK